MDVDVVPEAGGDAAPVDPPEGTDASSSLQTSPELDPFRLHPSISSPPEDPGAEAATADPAGGGDAPVGHGGGHGVAMTALTAFVISTLPTPSDAHSLSVYAEVPVVKMFDFVDPYIVVTLFCVWIIISYIFVAGIAYLLGRVSSPTNVQSMATLRPMPRTAVNDLPRSESAIYTTRYGTLWHQAQDCRLLELSSLILVREPCDACRRRTMQPVVARVAETPPGGQ
jgi:hypothetical protein